MKQNQYLLTFTCKQKIYLVKAYLKLKPSILWSTSENIVYHDTNYAKARSKSRTWKFPPINVVCSWCTQAVWWGCIAPYSHCVSAGRGGGREREEWKKLFAKSTMRLVLIHALERAWWGTVDKPALVMLFKRNLYPLSSKHIQMK